MQEVAAPLAASYSQLGLASQIGVALGGLIAISVVVHVLKQLLIVNPNEPPMVFSWFPIIGSTITYGMDPPKFFKEQQAKVRETSATVRNLRVMAWLTFSSSK